MIEGHGDDSYQYEGISSDFSSNISAHHGHQALMAYLASRPELIGHYPEPEAWSLEKMIAERLGLAPSQVIVTSGATEAIYLIAQAFSMKSVIPAPTFSEYEDACRMFQHPIITEGQRNEGLQADTMLWLCNPNNPTGEVYEQQFIDRMMAKYGLVVIDQSYEHYTDAHIMSPRWGGNAPFSIQIHSMTKTYAVPGLRLGYITAHPSLTEVIRRFIRPWSVSPLAVEAGKFLLEHDELRCQPELGEAQRLYRLLEQTEGVTVTPTQTNFMLCQLRHHTAAELKDYLIRKHRMLIRDASNFRGLSVRHFRIASQTPEENDALVKAISHFTTIHTDTTR